MMETGHVQLMVSYTLAPGVDEDDYDLWARQTAVPWWQNMPGFRAIRGYYTVVGSGARMVVEIDFDHMESLAKVMGMADYQQMRRDLQNFAVDIDTRILVPTGRTPG